MKHCCRNCAFLAKGENHLEKPWSEIERKKLKPLFEGQYAFGCYKGVWRSISQAIVTPCKTTLLQNRRNRCFFLPASRIEFKAAVELETRLFNNRHIRYTQIIATIAIIISAMSVIPYVPI